MQALHRLLKESEPQIPHRLKSVRDDKNKQLIGTTEVVPCYKPFSDRIFQRRVKPVWDGQCKGEQFSRRESGSRTNSDRSLSSNF